MGARAPEVFRGSGSPEGIVSASPGSLYTNTDEFGDVYHKFTLTNAYGWVAFAEKSRGNSQRYYVSPQGSDSDDGLSWGSAYLTIQKAITETATAPAVIYVGTGTYASFSIASNQTGIRVIGVNQGIGNSTKIVPSTTSETCVSIAGGFNTIESICVAPIANYTGKAFHLNNASFTRLFDCMVDAQQAAPEASGTYGGTGFYIENTEGCLFERLTIVRCTNGIDLVSEASENTFIAVRGSNNYHPLTIRSASGGNTFIHYKTTGDGDSTTPVTTVDISGGANLFLLSDWSEAGAHDAYVNSDYNTFVQCVFAPGTTQYVPGDDNTFIGCRVLGALSVSGSNNLFDKLQALGSAAINGSNNLLRGEVSLNNITGTGWVREAHKVSGDVVKSGTTAKAYPWVGVNSAPADAEIAAGQCFGWFDSTNGAAKMMFKAKQADGTVRTGSVALS